MAEHEALEQAKAELDSQLADALNTAAEVTALKEELEASLASTKATLQTSEENLVAAQVCIRTFLSFNRYIVEFRHFVASHA